MKDTKLFLIAAIMCFPPWAMISQSFGEVVQLPLLGVQLIGLGILILKRKQIWG